MAADLFDLAAERLEHHTELPGREGARIEPRNLERNAQRATRLELTEAGVVLEAFCGEVEQISRHAMSSPQPNPRRSRGC